MTGARLVHDTLEQEGWSVEIADAQKVKGLAPLACKTDKIDSKVLAVLSLRDLVPAIWLPGPRVREKRELARFRLHLVKHRSALKNRIHSTLISFGRPCPVTDLCGVEGRRLLGSLEVPEPWRGNVTASLALINSLEKQFGEVNHRLKEGHADHPYIALLMSAPGIGWVLAFTIAAEDRRDRALPITAEAHRLHRPLPKGGAVGRLPPPRTALKARAHLPALGAARGDHARAQAPRLRGALPAHQAPARPRDLAHAHSQRGVRSERRRFSSGGLTALLDLRPRAKHPIPPDPPAEEAIET
jgi:hypothetical protein